jgi:ABC-type branched-subunit amino acid transport system ATPase component
MEIFYICLASYLVAIVTHGLCRTYFQPIIIQEITQVKEVLVGPQHLMQCKEEMLWQNRYSGEDEHNRRQYQHEMREKLIHNLWEYGLIYYREDEHRGLYGDTEVRAKMIIQVMPPDKLPPHQRF